MMSHKANRIQACNLWILLAVCTVLPTCAQEKTAPPPGPVFKSGEYMQLRLPLDTASPLNGVFPIDSAGYARLPILGNVYANDVHTNDIEAYIATNASQYLRDVHVTATPVIRIALVGYWQHPGMLYVNSEGTVWDACKLSGGPAGEVNMDKWQVVRGSAYLSISLLDEFSKGTSLRNAGVHSGDLFVIPVPNPNSGFWYWFRETLHATADVATITSAFLSAYVTYLIIHEHWYPH